MDTLKVTKLNKLIGKKIIDAEYSYNGLDNNYKLILSDGTIISWGYEDNEGYSHIGKNKGEV